MSDTIRFFANGSVTPATTITQAVALGYITPPMVENYYGVPTSTGVNTKVGIISLGGGFQQSDLQLTFNDLYAAGQISSNVAPTITFISIDGATNNWTGNIQSADVENTLDIYCISTLVPQANVVIYIAPLTNNSFANAIQRAVNDNCDVISISWGGPESTDYLSAPLANAAAKGITVLCSSGDDGSDPYNQSPEPQFEGAVYPASSANVIAVGGTYAVVSGNVITGEYAAANSGGGISTIIPQPSWQTGIQATPYFYANSSSGTQFTITNYRATPDISAPWWFYVFYFNGTLMVEGGTSASCPVTAGMIARFISLNSGRRPVKGASTLNAGFYANINAFYNSTFNQAVNQYGNALINNDDVVAGVNGYVAKANQWDPITGLGRPIGQSVYEIATSNGTKVKTAANTWSYVANVKVKTAANTWSNVQAIYTKTVNGWQQTF